ncbi:MAG TPA: hypothetical protein VKV17_04505 [Bryobacteraceae bacterium]|nr:hypothetical protein [Bryobacteraceae bacterium]
MKTSTFLSRAVIIGSLSAAALAAAELQPATLQAWDAYLRTVRERVAERGADHKPFLWVDESTDRVARVHGGEVVVEPMIGRGVTNVPNGLIHDWIGAIFIPGATVESLSAVVHDYDDYKQLYRPAVTASRAHLHARRPAMAASTSNWKPSRSRAISRRR